MRRYLKDYAVACMDAYARNFGHPEIRDNRDLLWFGMVEKERYWKSHDREVRTNSRLDREIARLEERLVRGESPALRKEIASPAGAIYPGKQGPGRRKRRHCASHDAEGGGQLACAYHSEPPGMSPTRSI